MDFEQKYKEALERAKKFEETYGGGYSAYIFPELAKDEDERIRKELVEKISNLACGCFISQEQKKNFIAYLEKQKEQMPDNNISISPERLKELRDKSFEDGRKAGVAEMAKSIQKPAESISQLTVQGKGVYKICPRCKERMVRDDSMVYTSMPPQYRYECPKCGEREFDTVMYDNPEMEEQKQEWSEEENEPNIIGISPERLKELRDQSFEDGRKAGIAEMAKSMQKPAWSEEDERMIGRIRSVVNECASYNDALDVNGDYCEGDYAKLDTWLKSLPERKNLPPKQEWDKEDEIMLKWIEDILLIADDDLNDKLNGKVSPITDSAYSSMKRCIAKCLSWLKSLRPQYNGDVTMTEAYKMGKEAGEASHWKPSEEDLMMLEHIIGQYETGNKNSKVMGYLPRIEELDFLKKVFAIWKN